MREMQEIIRDLSRGLEELKNYSPITSLSAARKEELKLEQILNDIKTILEKNLGANHEVKKTLTVEECSKLSGIGIGTLQELIHKKNTDFPFFKVGRKNFINRGLFEIWLDKVTEEHRTI